MVLLYSVPMAGCFSSMEFDGSGMYFRGLFDSSGRGCVVLVVSVTAEWEDTMLGILHYRMKIGDFS